VLAELYRDGEDEQHFSGSSFNIDFTLPILVSNPGLDCNRSVTRYLNHGIEFKKFNVYLTENTVYLHSVKQIN